MRRVVVKSNFVVGEERFCQEPGLFLELYRRWRYFVKIREDPESLMQGNCRLDADQE